MKGLDTNVLVRFLVNDDPAQAAIAAKFILTECTPESPGILNRIVLCELTWVLGRAYGYPRSLIAEILEKLLRTCEFSIEGVDDVWTALRAYRAGTADFADCLVGTGNRSLGCDATATFDRKAGRMPEFLLLK